MMGHIMILVHPATSAAEVSRWAIDELAKIWVNDGLKVQYMAGIRTRHPADVLIVHVDMSEVPQQVLDFAASYPVSINARVKDIRKRTISHHQVVPGDGWSGPVIVKSNLNCCGLGELLVGVKDPKGVRPPKFPFKMEKQTDYRVFDRVEQMPAEYFNDQSVVVERFLPERSGDLYYTRSYHFLGSKTSTVLLSSDQPIVLGQNAKSLQQIEPDPEVVQFREQFGLQYGKIDYVMYEGRAVILDVNKTTGAGGISKDPRVQELRRYRASGIYDFLRR
jgi:hypothetical protein